MPVRRITHRCSTGPKLHAVRESKRSFKDIRTHSRAHAADIKRNGKEEKAE
jgi:hypothetical protein